MHEYILSAILPGTSLHDGFVPVYMDDLDPAQPCVVVEEMTSSSGSANSVIGTEPCKGMDVGDTGFSLCGGSVKTTKSLSAF